MFEIIGKVDEKLINRNNETHDSVFPTRKFSFHLSTNTKLGKLV